jgi:hypothetical protein
MTPLAFLSADDIAGRLGVGRSTAYALMRQMPRFRTGRVTRVLERDFAAWVEERVIPAVAPPAHGSAGARRYTRPTVKRPSSKPSESNGARRIRLTIKRTR